MANEMTRKEALTIAITALEDSNLPTDEQAVTVLTHMLDQLNKPKAKTDTKSKARLDNEATARRLHEIAPEETFDSKYVMAHTTALTPQKVVGIMKVGIELGLFERLMDGKQVVYRKIGWLQETPLGASFSFFDLLRTARSTKKALSPACQDFFVRNHKTYTI